MFLKLFASYVIVFQILFSLKTLQLKTVSLLLGQPQKPESHDVLDRVIAWNTRGPGFNPTNLQMIVLLSGIS